MTGAAPKKKAVASEGSNESASELLQSYTALMREAGSPNGAWNPEPDEHILGVLREDVQLSPNEIKGISYVKLCCLRQKPKGRTAWGWTETGKKLRATEIGAFFGWDPGNTAKYLRRPLAYGFIRKNAEDQFGIGARVHGQFTEEESAGEPPSEVDLLVCTDKLPRYLAEVVVKKYDPKTRDRFLQRWRAIKSEARQTLAAEKQRIYEQEQNELSEYCRTFDPELPDLKRKAKDDAPDEPHGLEAHLSVQTNGEHSSVQNGSAPLYNGSNGTVRTTHIRKQSKAVSNERFSSSSFPLTAAAFHAKAQQVDDDAIRQLVLACRQVEAEASDEEIAQFLTGEPTRRNVMNPVGFLLTAVPRRFASPAYRKMKQAQAAAAKEGRRDAAEARESEAMDRWRREQEAALADPGVPEQEKHLIRLCLGLDSDHSAHAQKAGER